MNLKHKYLLGLILVAILALILLQAFWLKSMHQIAIQDLKDKSREALLETTIQLRKLEDAKYLMTNIDTVLNHDITIDSTTKSILKNIVSGVKGVPKIKKITEKWVEKNPTLKKDSSVSTTIFKSEKNNETRIIIKSQTKREDHLQNRAENLGSLFIKMALNNQTSIEDYSQQIDFDQVKSILISELNKRGVFMTPEILIEEYSDYSKSKIILFSTAFSEKAIFITAMPLEDIAEKITISIGYISMTGFLIKKLIWVILSSLLITLLIAAILIRLFKQMMNEKRLNQLKNDFINNMTHELKTPVATISLAIDAIKNPTIYTDKSKLHIYTSILKEENDKLNTHIERVLNAAQIESGKINLVKEKINLVDLIQDCILNLELQAEAKGASIAFVNETSEAQILADSLHIKSVILNLLDNALKYSKPNCHIECSLKIENRQVVLSIKDNGMGIEASQLDQIFEKFYRVQKGNIHDVKGFGLGLSYVKSILDAHQATIELKSKINMGSEFILKFNQHEA